MMEYREINHPVFKESLYITNGVVELIVPLTFGIRIAHFAFCGEENVLYEHPWDADYLTTEKGWRHGGGHRFWITPETEDSYYPDNDPISYAVEGDSILLTQAEDPWLKAEKSIRITLKEDAVQVCHRLKNTGSETRTCALWGVTALAKGGVAHIPAGPIANEYQPVRNISLWEYTSLSDPRLHFEENEILLKWEDVQKKFKFGVGHPDGPIRYENGNTVFYLEYPIEEAKPYADRNVSFEAFLCRYMIELESLSALMEIPVGQTREYTETWRLMKTLS